MNDTCLACARSDSAVRSLAEHGERLTGLRRDVIRALHHLPRPVGAYDLFNQLKKEGRASAPPAVYRVLDFLVEQGLVHKLPSLSAYAPCRAEPHEHAACFLICHSCGGVDELTRPDLSALKKAAIATGFVAEHVSIEFSGVCSACASL